MSRKEPQPDLIWARPSQPRDAQFSLSREQIVRVAMHMADAEGLQRISMRRIAAELDAAAMSLYRHIRSKDDLLDLMLDAGFGELALPEQLSGDWRADLRKLAAEVRTILKRHPWLAVLLSSRPPLGPNYLRYFEFLLSTVAGLGLSIDVMMRIAGAVFVYVMGYVSYELAEEENTRRTGLTEEDKHALAAPYVQQVIASGEFPNFERFYRAGAAPPDGEGFAFGLDCLLDGLAARLLPNADK
ncbi:MAG: TetR/AcrR family transcriptional regulator C-terminal domain-containing protein [Chloroflexi bacterium]|nr:TetR/AcrR family transcriptional regulator C-terminal domain-containing protein [Chloroflexota bacterium]